MLGVKKQKHSNLGIKHGKPESLGIKHIQIKSKDVNYQMANNEPKKSPLERK